MTSERLGFVLGAEQAALLQHRYDMVDEGFESAWVLRYQNVEAVAGPGAEPCLQLVGDLLRRADRRPVDDAEASVHRVREAPQADT